MKKIIITILNHKILILILVSFFIYSFSLKNEFFQDDIYVLYYNIGLQSSEFLNTIIKGIINDTAPGIASLPNFYRPFMLFMLGIMYRLFHYEVFGYHLVQISFHTLNGILLYKLFVNFFQNTFNEKTKTFAFLTSLLFIVHPINVEPTVYLSSLSDPMSTFFILVSLINAQSINDKKSNYKKYIFLFFSTLLGLLTKESAISIFPLLILFSLLFHKKILWPVLVIFIINLCIYLYLRFFVAQISMSASYWIFTQPLSVRLQTIPKEIFQYLLTYFFPQKLFILQQWAVTKLTFADFYIPLITNLLLLIVATVAMIKKKNKILFFFFCWFSISLFPVLNVIPTDLTIADRFFYLPQIGLLGILTFAFYNLYTKNKYLFTAFFITIIIIFSIRSIQRINDWKTPLTLLKKDVVYNDTSPLLYNYLGFELLKIKNYKDAKHYLDKGVFLKNNFAEIHTNLGLYYEQINDFKNAEKEYLKAISLKTDFNTYQNLANLYLKTKQYDQAIFTCKKGLSHFPNNLELTKMGTVALYLIGDHVQSEIWAKKLLNLDYSANSKYIYTQVITKQPLEVNFIKILR